MCQLQVLTYNGKKKKKKNLYQKEACMFLSKYEKGVENMFLFLILLGFDNYRFTKCQNSKKETGVTTKSYLCGSSSLKYSNLICEMSFIRE